MRRGLGVAAVALAAAGLLMEAGPAWSSAGHGAERYAEAAGTSDPALARIEAMAGATTTMPGTDGETGTGGVDECEWYPAALFLYLENLDAYLADPGDEMFETERTAPDGTPEFLYARVCYPDVVTFHWLRDLAAPEQAAAAALAVAQEKIPAPDGVFAPDLGRGATAFAQAPMRFGIRNAGAVTASASVSGVTASVTATPRRLKFIPGDGSPAAACEISASRQPATACTYTYRDSSAVAPNGESWPAHLSVEWAVGWTATTGAGGALPAVTTTADYAVPVREIQALEYAD
ncbi:hypothetical protein [Parafrankia sp. EUN1f]|uniref:hypothetical protein n=1 Tax=Parafrankia sp. EUN1f TaxID=102897 RepID=UPI0001C45FE1|nr:hypothetical protein [Parafrankia sp. EUN1f]EFC81309.1 hypothetical protein FrEUN1fDRAFT_5556 [Parafrankia sp. EUN1f]